MIAVLCNGRRRGIGMVRLIVFLPSLIPLFAGAVLWGWLFNRDFGLVNYVLERLGLPRQGFFQDPSQALPLTIFIGIWGIGSAFLTYLSGLQSVPPDLYEAITIDGGGALRRFWHVTLPMLSPVIIFNTVIGIVLSFQVFDIAWVLTKGGPADSTLFWVLLIYRKAFEEFQLGYASALAWLLFLTVAVCTAVIFRASRHWVYYAGADRDRRPRPSPRSPAMAVHAMAIGAIGLLMLVPIYYLIYLAFSKPGTEFDFPPTAIPSPISWGNVLAAPRGDVTSLWTPARNSLLYAGLATAGCLLTQSMAGFAFARLRFPGRNVLFALTVAMLMMPFVATMVPRFLLFRRLGMIDTIWPLIIPWWFGGSPYGIFLMRQFFLSLPMELDEAARVDGAGPWRTYWSILMPQATPILVALGMLEFVFFWNDLLGPLIYVQSQRWRTLPQSILFNYRGTYNPQWSLFMMSVLWMVVPVALMFLVLQRRFRQGFLFSGLGGR